MPSSTSSPFRSLGVVLVAVLVLCLLVVESGCQPIPTSTPTPSPSPSPSGPSPSASPTPAPAPSPTPTDDIDSCISIGDNCGDCTGNSDCVWCEVKDGSVNAQCISGDIGGPSGRYAEQYCNHYYHNQCAVSGYLLSPAFSYVTLIIILVILIFVIILIVFLCMYAAKKGAFDRCGCSCHGCCNRGIKKKDIRTARPGEDWGTGPNISALVAAGPGASQKKNDIAVAPPEYVAPPTPHIPLNDLIMPEDLDYVNLPPGFEAKPPEPMFIENGTEEQYKTFMIAKLKKETWENQLLLYYRRNKEFADKHRKKQ